MLFWTRTRIKIDQFFGVGSGSWKNNSGPGPDNEKMKFRVPGPDRIVQKHRVLIRVRVPDTSLVLTFNHQRKTIIKITVCECYKFTTRNIYTVEKVPKTFKFGIHCKL